MDLEKYRQIEVSWPKKIAISSSDGRVKLETFTVDDAPEIFDLINKNRDHLSQFGDRTANKYKSVESVISSITRPPKLNRLRFTIRNQEGTLVGSINITPGENNSKSAEIGYYLGSEFTGKGYMAESLKTLSTYAFSVLGCDKVYERIANGNEKSIKVAEKCGFTKCEMDRNTTVFILRRT